LEGLKKKRGRQRRRLVDDIKDWTGLDIHNAVHMAHVQGRRPIRIRKNTIVGPYRP
jgi:hypothetical protein